MAAEGAGVAHAAGPSEARRLQLSAKRTATNRDVPHPLTNFTHGNHNREFVLERAQFRIYLGSLEKKLIVPEVCSPGSL
jgi:hypothetical protein